MIKTVYKIYLDFNKELEIYKSHAQTFIEFEKEKNIKYIKVEDVKSLIESVYNKYVVPDNVNGVNTEHIVIGGVRFKTLVNHPISAMRVELLEQLESNQTKDLLNNNEVSSTEDKVD